ncbi:MAG: PA2169 family four-helix-bundle protein [Chitinophagales bacterium]
MEGNKDMVKDLNSLVEINNDRVEGYKKAMKETEDSDLKEVFKDMAEHSFKFKNELADEIMKAGGEPTTGTKTTGKIYRAWMDIRSALTNKDRKAILSSCEYGEDAALETYEEVLKSSNLSQAARSVIDQQKGLLAQDHNKIKAMRDLEKNKG